MAKNKEKTQKDQKPSTPMIKHKKAYHDYELIEKVEAGMVLTGSEVKSLRLGHGDLNASYARIRNGECYLIGSKIDSYDQASYNNHDPLRDRKLLLHKRQISKLITKLDQRGFTLVPLRIYFTRGLVKIELAIGRGKKQFDKRQTLQDKQQVRDLARELKRR